MIADPLIHQQNRLLSFFNIDLTLYFMVFYTLGYIAFDRIRSLLEMDTLQKKAGFAAAACVSGLYTIVVFFGKSPLHDLCSFSRITSLCADLIHPLILSIFILILAKLIEDLGFLRTIGQETLYMCGSEFLIDTSLMTSLLFFSVIPNYANSFAPYLYAMALLTIGHYIFAPLEKAILNKLGC